MDILLSKATILLEIEGFFLATIISTFPCARIHHMLQYALYIYLWYFIQVLFQW